MTKARVLADYVASGVTAAEFDFLDVTSGTADATTFLRGDKTWQVVDTEGTGIKSTGESGGNKFLREDGDGTSSWQEAGSPSISDGGNATAITIDSSENVGIGESVPAYKLHLKTSDGGTQPSWDATAARNLALFETGENEAAVTIFSPASATSLYYAFADPGSRLAGYIKYNHSTTKMFLGTEAEDQVTIDGSGNVGIGTSSPVANFTVAGGEGASGIMNLWADEGDDNADKWKMEADTSGNLKIATYIAGAWRSGITLQPDQQPNGAHVICGLFQSGRTFNNMNLMVCDAQNNAPMIGFVSQSSAPNASSRNWCIRSNAISYGDLAFFKSADQTGTPQQGDHVLSLQSNGRVGIGMAGAPSEVLEVVGVIKGDQRGQQFKIGTGWWSGAVTAGNTTQAFFLTGGKKVGWVASLGTENNRNSGFRMYGYLWNSHNGMAMSERYNLVQGNGYGNGWIDVSGNNIRYRAHSSWHNNAYVKLHSIMGD